MQYEGGFKQDKKCGHGKFISKTAGTYDGEWLDDMKHGSGTYIWTDLSEYAGSWSKDKKCGSGVFTWPDGRRYNGEWKDDTHTGHVCFTIWLFNVRPISHPCNRVDLTGLMGRAMMVSGTMANSTAWGASLLLMDFRA